MGQLSPYTTTTDACTPQNPCPAAREATAMRSPLTATREQPPFTTTREGLCAAMKTQGSKINKYICVYIFKKKKKEHMPKFSLIMKDFALFPQPTETSSIYQMNYVSCTWSLSCIWSFILEYEESFPTVFIIFYVLCWTIFTVLCQFQV